MDADPRARVAVEAMRALACTFIAGAGLAQRAVVLRGDAAEERAKAAA